MDEIRQELTKSLKVKNVEENGALLPETFKFDKICPFFIIFHSSLRGLITQSSLVLHDKLIVQVVLYIKKLRSLNNLRKII